MPGAQNLKQEKLDAKVGKEFDHNLNRKWARNKNLKGFSIGRFWFRRLVTQKRFDRNFGRV